MSDPRSCFNRMRRGEVAPPPVATLLGGAIRAVDIETGTLQADYLGAPGFANPAGQVQGGMLCAMLDDLSAGLVDATLAAGEGVATLNLNVSFLRPARPGPLEGEARLVRRGRDICHVNAMLCQDGQEVAVAMATCKVLRGRP